MHLEVRFVARAGGMSELRSPEGLELRWFAPSEIEESGLAEASVAALATASRAVGLC
jgi:hypothetical protein